MVLFKKHLLVIYSFAEGKEVYTHSRAKSRVEEGQPLSVPASSRRNSLLRTLSSRGISVGIGPPVIAEGGSLHNSAEELDGTGAGDSATVPEVTLGIRLEDGGNNLACYVIGIDGEEVLELESFNSSDGISGVVEPPHKAVRSVSRLDPDLDSVSWLHGNGLLVASAKGGVGLGSTIEDTGLGTSVNRTSRTVVDSVEPGQSIIDGPEAVGVSSDGGSSQVVFLSQVQVQVLRHVGNREFASEAVLRDTSRGLRLESLLRLDQVINEGPGTVASVEFFPGLVNPFRTAESLQIAAYLVRVEGVGLEKIESWDSRSFNRDITNSDVSAIAVERGTGSNSIVTVVEDRSEAREGSVTELIGVVAEERRLEHVGSPGEVVVTVGECSDGINTRAALVEFG